MYRELQPLRQALSVEQKANLPPARPGLEAEHLLQTYLDRLTMSVGCDVADQVSKTIQEALFARRGVIFYNDFASYVNS